MEDNLLNGKGGNNTTHTSPLSSWPNKAWWSSIFSMMPRANRRMPPPPLSYQPCLFGQQTQLCVLHVLHGIINAYFTLLRTGNQSLRNECKSASFYFLSNTIRLCRQLCCDLYSFREQIKYEKVVHNMCLIDDDYMIMVLIMTVCNDVWSLDTFEMSHNNFFQNKCSQSISPLCPLYILPLA